MEERREKRSEIPAPNAFKVVGLAASIFAMLAIIVGAVVWVSKGLVSNAVDIQSLRKEHRRDVESVTENTRIINQHAQLLAILKLHGEKIRDFDIFMTKGGRFTADDGTRLREELDAVRERLMHYQVLEAELRWIKESMKNISDQMNVIARKQDRVFEMHEGFPHGTHKGGLEEERRWHK